AEGGPVVVPADRLHPSVPQNLQDLVRPRIVPDEVAGDPDPGGGDPVDVREDGLQGRQVRVHVGEDREVHPAADRRGGLYDVLNTRRGGSDNSNNGTPQARTSACGHSPRSAPHGVRRSSSTETTGSRRASSARRGTRPPSPRRTSDRRPSGGHGHPGS